MGKKDQKLAAEAANQAARAAHEHNIALKKLNATMGATEAANIRTADSYRQLIMLSDEQKAASARYLESLVQLAEQTGVVTEESRKQAEVARMLRNDLSQVTDAAAAVKSKIQGMLGITTQWKNDITASFVASARAGKGFITTLDEIAAKQDGLAAKQNFWGSMSLKATETVQLGYMAVIKQTMNLASAFDSQTAAFKRATGASQKYAMMIPALEREFYNLGLSMEDASGLMQSLYSSLTGFTRMSASHQLAVAKTTSVLVSLGHNAETITRQLEMMNRSLGMTGSQAAATTREIYSLAKQLGISTQSMMESFARLGPQLVVHGNSAIHVFKRLAKAAKDTGLDMEKMIGIAKGFDTFRDAGQSVGFLNSQLGGNYLSVMRMVQATDPTERMRLLSQATRRAGLEFDKMGYYQRQAVAGAMGLSDVNDLALIMRGNFKLVNDQTLQTSASIAKLAQENREYKTVQDELRQVLRSMAVPITRLLRGIREFLIYLQNTPAAVERVINVMVALKSVMFGIQVASAAANMGMVGFAAAAAGGLGAVLAFSGAMALLHNTMAVKRHSPTLFGPDSIFGWANSQAGGLSMALQRASLSAKLAAPQFEAMGRKLKAMPKDVLRTVKTVFDAESDVFAAAKGANITRQHIALIGAATAGQASGRPVVIDNRIDLNLKEKTLQTVFKRGSNVLSDRV